MAPSLPPSGRRAQPHLVAHDFFLLSIPLLNDKLRSDLLHCYSLSPQSGMPVLAGSQLGSV
ncbi:hypothetical protein TRIUR3_34087 [Triticum urartu]|uniref:Uncharacterized protein n=1 Tax=Triticum urartu TaxID=4572 RepID=M7Z2Q6_TRIUA|nr:hypothetical protein TRIUR3_34087 [Triticum urartu]